MCNPSKQGTRQRIALLSPPTYRNTQTPRPPPTKGNTHPLRISESKPQPTDPAPTPNRGNQGDNQVTSDTPDRPLETVPDVARRRWKEAMFARHYASGRMSLCTPRWQHVPIPSTPTIYYPDTVLRMFGIDPYPRTTNCVRLTEYMREFLHTSRNKPNGP